MTDDTIREYFVLEHGGPNPYFKCIKCGAVEPGLREYLEQHVNFHIGSPSRSGDEAFQLTKGSLK